MTLPGGRGGVLLIVLAAWTLGAVIILVVSTLAQADDIVAYNRLVAEHGLVVAQAYDVADPSLVLGMMGLIVGCAWLPVAVVLLIASIALWSRRT